MRQLLPLTLFLLGAFLLSMAGSHFQHRYYLRTVNELAREYGRSGYALVSGIRRGRLRGAVAVLVLRRGEADVVEEALIMSGATLLARFRPHPELTGRVTEETLAGCHRTVRGAMRDALERGRKLEHGGSPDDQADARPRLAAP